MYPQLGAQVSWAGGVSMIISACTILSALASDRLNERLGTGRVTAISVCHHGSGAARVFLLPCVLAALPVGYPLWAGRGQRGCSLKQLCCPALQKSPYELAALHVGCGCQPWPRYYGAGTGRFRLAGRLPHHWHFAGGADSGAAVQPALWKLPQDAMGGEPFTPQHRSFPELLKITGCAGSSSLLFVLLRTGIHRRDVGLQLLHPSARFGCPDRCQLGQPVLFGHYRRAVLFPAF